MGVGGGIAGLAAAAPGGGDGGEEDERVEVGVGEHGMEVGGAGHLRVQHVRQLRRTDLLQRSDLPRPRRVHHRADRGAVGLQGAGECGQCLTVGGVAGHDGGPGAELLDRGAQFGRTGCVGAAAAGQDDVAGAVGGRPPGDPGPQTTGTTGDQHRAPHLPRQVALAGAQRLRRQVQGDQRRRARRVHRHRRPLQTEGVGQPAGEHTGRRAGQELTTDALLALGQCPTSIALTATADEDTGTAAPQGGGSYPRSLHRRPSRLQGQALLGVHGKGLAGRDAEELGIEGAGVVKEPSDPREPSGSGVQVCERDALPAAVHREAGDALQSGTDHLPEVFGRCHRSRQPAAHTDDRDRIVVNGRRPDVGRSNARGRLVREVLGKVRGQGLRVRVVEHQGRGQVQPGLLGEAVP